MRRGTWVFWLPAVFCLAVVAGYPLARTLVYSFTDAKLSSLDQVAWNGLANYGYLLADPDWWRAVRNTLVFTFFSVLLETLLGLAFALVLHQTFRGRGLVRAAVLVPWAIPSVVSAKIWAWMANDSYGVINELLLKSGLLSERVAWLAEDRLALAVLVAVDVWKTTPFMAFLCLAGLQGIPGAVYEAARIDGANAWQRFLHITLPLLRPTLLVAMIFRTMDALRVFDLPYVLTSNSRNTAVMSIYARQQLVDFQDVGAGSAASFLVFCVIGVIAAAYLALGRQSLELDSRAGKGGL